jgi:MFS family permease
MPTAGSEKEGMLFPGVTKAKATVVFISVFLILMPGTLSSQGINNIQSALLTKFDAMKYFTLLSACATMGMLMFMPLGGKFADMFGRKAVCIFGAIIFAVPSFLAGFAPNLVSFMVLRALIPIGQAVTMTSAYATLGGTFKGKGRNMAFSALAAVTNLGMFFGGTIAGWLAEKGVSWVAIFYPGVMIVLGTILLSTQIKNTKRDEKPFVDVPGIIFLIILVFGLMYSTNMGGVSGWGSPMILLTLAMFAVGLVGFIMVERKSKEPIMMVSLFKNPTVTVMMAIVVLSVMYQRSMNVYIPQFGQKVMGLSATVTGTFSSVRAVVTIVFPTICTAWLVRKLEKRIWKSLALLGLMVVIAFLFIFRADASTPLILFYISFGFMGLAEAFKAGVPGPYLQNLVDTKDLGAATSLNSFFGTAGSALASCLTGLYYNAVIKDPNDIPSVQGGLTSLFTMTILTGVLIIVLAAVFVRSFMNQAAAKKAEAAAQSA